MKKTSLNRELEQATLKLLEMARNSCWNKISKNCEFILSEINKDATTNFFEERKLRKNENSNKTPTSLNETVNSLKEIYDNLYDVNLYIFHAKKNKTIIDVRYFLKSRLEHTYQEEAIDKEPMLHCKIGIPPYHIDKENKYDVNWELGGIRDKWNMFLWRSKLYNNDL